jgi:hypothetical protein
MRKQRMATRASVYHLAARMFGRGRVFLCVDNQAPDAKRRDELRHRGIEDNRHRCRVLVVKGAVRRRPPYGVPYRERVAAGDDWAAVEAGLRFNQSAVCV